MEKLGNSLKECLKNTKNKRFNFQTSIQIGVQLVELLSKLHGEGFLHLDLKPQNILIGNNNPKDPRNSKIYLIDFGVSKSYLDERGEHKIDSPDVHFEGNILFASPNAFRRHSKF